jgi:signal transduction histidine kinase
MRKESGVLQVKATISPESRRLRFLELLAASAADMMAAADPQMLINRLFETIRAELNLDIFFHYRYETGDQLSLANHGGITADIVERAATLPLGEGVCGRVARSRKPVVLSNVQRSRSPASVYLRAMGIDAYACSPLLHGEILLGTLGFGRRGTGCFDDAEIRFMQTICGHVALAEHRIRTEQVLRAGLAERERLLAEQREMEQKLVELTRVSALGAVATTIAHELNQPLSAASNFISALRYDPAPTKERVAELSRSAERQLVRAGEIVRRIRQMVSREGLSLEEDALEPIIDEATGLVQAALGGKLPRFQKSVAPDAARALVDHIQIVQVLGNLLRNAVEANPKRDGTEVTIETRRVSPEEVAISVIDHGPGLADELRAAMLDPRGTRSRNGLGLGLSISSTLIEAHGGSIRAEDTPGGGATFCFTVPAPLDR